MVSILRFTLAECDPQGILPDDISMDEARGLEVMVDARNAKEKEKADKSKAAKIQAAQDQVDDPDPLLAEAKPKKPRRRKSRYMALL